MKVIINQNERGLVFRNGIYSRMLEPGKNKVKQFFGETFFRLPIDKQIKIPDVNIDFLMQDKEFSKSVIKIDVPDGHIAVRFEDGRISGAHEPGKHFFFNCLNNITYKLFNTAKAEIDGLSAEQIDRLPKNIYSKTIVNEGQTGLLFFTVNLSAVYLLGHIIFGIQRRLPAKLLICECRNLLSADRKS